VCQPISSSNEWPCERTSNWVTLLDLLAFLDANLDNNTRHRRSKGAGGVGGSLPRNGLDSGVFVLHGDSTDLENEDRTLGNCNIAAQQHPYLSVNLEPNITLSAAFDDRSDSHETDDEGLSRLNRDMHLLANVRTPQEVARRNNTVTEMSKAIPKSD
jgi:hypothetical protein